MAKSWQMEIAMGILSNETGFKRGDHIIFRGFSGEDIYGTIIGISESAEHFRVRTDKQDSWHVEPESMVFAD